MSIHTQIRPDNSQKIAMKDGLGTFFLYLNSKGSACVRLYKGKSKKPKDYYFRSPESRAEYIARTMANLSAAAEEKARYRAERNKPHTLEKGLILYTSWGYDQTNTEFYAVIDVPSACYVTLQQISAPLVRGEESFMSGNRMPDPDQTIGDSFRRKVDMSGSRPSVKIDSVANAWIWDGKEKRVSWYA